MEVAQYLCVWHIKNQFAWEVPPKKSCKWLENVFGSVMLVVGYVVKIMIFSLMITLIDDYINWVKTFYVCSQNFLSV